MAKEKYGRDAYASYLGRLIDPKDSKKAEDEAAEKAALKLSDLEAYYRQWVEDHLYNQQNVYTNPTLTDADRERLTQMDSDDFNRFLNAYLLILQEQGIDVNNPSAYLDGRQREMNYLDGQIAELEKKTRNKEQQAKYEDLLEQRRLAEEQYNKANDVWKYTQDARSKGWTPSTVGDSGVDFGAIDQSAADRQYMQDRMAEGFGSGGDLSSLWLPEEKEKTRTWNGGVYNGHYIAPGTYTQEEWEEATTSAFTRVGEDGLTDGQRMMKQQEESRQRAEESRRQAMMASLIDGGGSSASRNNTTGWLSDEYPDINTNVANPNNAAITLTDAGREYLAKLAAEEETASRPASSGTQTLASLLGGSGGSYSGVRSSNVGPTGLTAEETEEMQKNAYLGMLDAMARGRANTGGYTNTAALQSANAVYDAYKDVLPDENRMASYLRYQGDSGNRAAQPAYNWLNRATNGGYGTTEPAVTAPVTGAAQTQGSVGTIPTVSGGTPVSGTPVGVVRPQGTSGGNNALSWLSGILSGQRTGVSASGSTGGAGLRAPTIMRAQDNDIRQYLNAFLRR